MNEKITYQGKIVEVVEHDVIIGEKTKTFEFARRSPGVRLIIIKNNTVYLSKEFRHEMQGYDYRLPGGKVFDTLVEFNTALSNKEDILESAKAAAIKEAREEMGIITNSIELFHTSVCGATVQWDLYYFIISDFTQENQNLEDGEDIELFPVSIDEAKSMCLDGRIDEERSALTLLRYLNKNQD
jgi:ADP-ribose pyrophosphatase YjhB (NUDIX family)